MKRTIAIIYTFAVLAAVILGLVGQPGGPLNFIFVVILAMPWTLVAKRLEGLPTWFGATIVWGGLLLNAALLWWLALRRTRTMSVS